MYNIKVTTRQLRIVQFGLMYTWHLTIVFYQPHLHSLAQATERRIVKICKSAMFQHVKSRSEIIVSTAFFISFAFLRVVLRNYDFQKTLI
jgi:hypothetical protein